MSLRRSSEDERDAERERNAQLGISAAAIVGAGVLGAVGLYHLFSGNSGPQIEVIITQGACDRAVRKLRQACKKCPILGFDCEWVGTNTVALIQLSTTDYCALFRICIMGCVPAVLDDLLEDENIRKVGVGIFEDAVKLRNELGVDVSGTLDLRFLAVMTGHEPRGLAALSKSVLNEPMDVSLNVTLSNWEAETLDENQVKYAADDAIKGFKIFEKLTAGKSGNLAKLWEYVDVRFSPHRHGDLPRINEDCVIQ